MDTDYTEYYKGLAKKEIQRADTDGFSYEGLPPDMLKYVQDEIVAMDSPKHACLLARDVPGADKDTLQNIVLRSKDPTYAYAFAAFVKDDVDTAALQQVVLNSKDGHLAAQFASCVKDANVEALQKIVLEYGNAEDACYLAQSGKDVDIEALQAKVLEGTDGQAACKFAWHVPGANIPALQRHTEQYGSVQNVINFAEHVPGADIPAIQEFVEKNLEYPQQLINFIKGAEDADIARAFEFLYKIANNEPDSDAADAARSVIIWAKMDTKLMERAKLQAEHRGSEKAEKEDPSQSKPVDPNRVFSTTLAAIKACGTASKENLEKPAKPNGTLKL